MKEPSAPNAEKSDGPPGWVLASQLGMTLVAYTCVFAFAGYFIGDHFMGSRYWALGLMLTGLFGGFGAAIYHIFRTSQKIDKSMPNRGKPLVDEPREEEKS